MRLASSSTSSQLASQSTFRNRRLHRPELVDEILGNAGLGRYVLEARRVVLVSPTLIPYETDELTPHPRPPRERGAKPVAGMTLGSFRDHLLSHECDTSALAALAHGITPEIAAAVSKLMRNQLIAVARKCAVVTRFRNTIGCQGRLPYAYSEPRD